MLLEKGAAAPIARCLPASTVGRRRSRPRGCARGLPHGAPGGAFPFSPLLAIDPNDPGLVYAAAADFGVYRSDDGGGHWQPILAGLPPLNPTVQGLPARRGGV
jgi:hypothetical protein